MELEDLELQEQVLILEELENPTEEDKQNLKELKETLENLTN